MIVYLARHGETRANFDGIILGRSDARLTETGNSVAAKFGSLLKGGRISSILTSPLGRARTSGSIIAQKVGITPVTIDELMELSCGQWEGRPRGEVLGEGKTIRPSWTHRPPGGESCKDAEARVSRAIDIIERKTQKGPVLVVGHAVLNRVLLRLWYQLDPVFANDLVQPHDLIYVLRREGPIHWLCSDGSTGTSYVPLKA